MQQSFFLNEFIYEIVRTTGASREAVVREFEAAALRAAYRQFGDATPIEIGLGPELGEVRFAQVLRVVEAPADPKREISLLALKRSGRDVGAGDELRVPIFYTHDPNDRVEIARLTAELGDLLPLPVHSIELWDRLT